MVQRSSVIPFFRFFCRRFVSSAQFSRCLFILSDLLRSFILGFTPSTESLESLGDTQTF